MLFFGIVQMNGSPTPTARRAPGAGANDSCSCWDGIGACKASGDQCVPHGGVGEACTGTCAVEDPEDDSKRLSRLQARYPGLFQQQETMDRN